MGMTVSKNTLCNWLKKGKKYLDELVCVLKSIALEKDSIVNCDETWCKVRKYDHYKKCYIWVLVNKAQKTAIFFCLNSVKARKPSASTNDLALSPLLVGHSGRVSAYTPYATPMMAQAKNCP